MRERALNTTYSTHSTRKNVPAAPLPRPIRATQRCRNGAGAAPGPGGAHGASRLQAHEPRAHLASVDGFQGGNVYVAYHNFTRQRGTLPCCAAPAVTPDMRHGKGGATHVRACAAQHVRREPYWLHAPKDAREPMRCCRMTRSRGGAAPGARFERTSNFNLPSSGKAKSDAPYSRQNGSAGAKASKPGPEKRGPGRPRRGRRRPTASAWLDA